MHPYPYGPVVGPGPFAGVDVVMGQLVILLTLIGVVVVLLLVLCYGVPAVVRCFSRRRQSRRKRYDPYNGRNPFENWPVQDGDEEPIPLAKVHRSPVRLLYSAAFERLTDGEILEINTKARGAVARLRNATEALAQCRKDDAINLCFVALSIVRRGFGEGKHWLEAVILADIATFHHHGNDAEESQRYFERASKIAEPWMQQYPWLRKLCTPRRLIRF